MKHHIHPHCETLSFVDMLNYKCAFWKLCGPDVLTGNFQLWGQSIQVNWAVPEKDADEEVMQRVRVLYVSKRVRP